MKGTRKAVKEMEERAEEAHTQFRIPKHMKHMQASGKQGQRETCICMRKSPALALSCTCARAESNYKRPYLNDVQACLYLQQAQRGP